MTAPTHLDAGGLAIPLDYDWTGPVIAMTPPFEPLAWVVNVWARGEFLDLPDKVRRGETATWQGFGAVPVAQADIEPSSRDVWRELSHDRPLDEPVIVSSVMVFSPFVLPRAALVDILDKLGALRAQWTKGPQSVPAVTTAAAEPDALPPAQLFRREPTAGEPTELERLALVDTEQLAIALDAAEAAATTIDQREDVAARRRVLLDELEAYGLLDAARVADKRDHLARWGLSRLGGYVDASVALRAYYASAVRATYAVPPPPAHVLDGHVSLDWFRNHLATPVDATPDGWLAFCEHVLVDNMPKSAAGEILSKLGQRWYQIRYRIETRPHPVVVSASER